MDEHNTGLVAWRIIRGIYVVRLGGRCNVYFWHLLGVDHNITRAMMMLLFGLHCGRMCWPIRAALCTIHKL